MKKFSFNLEPVLNHRKMLEELEQQKLLKVQQSILEMERLRENLRHEAQGCRTNLSQPQAGSIDIEQLRHLARYLEKLEGDIHQSSLLLARLEEDRRLQSDKYIDARKNREVVEKLKEKSFAHYQYDLKEMEQKLLDDITSVRFSPASEQNLPASKKNQ